VVAMGGLLSLFIFTVIVLFRLVNSWGGSYGASGINSLAFSGVEDVMDPLWLILVFL